MPKFRVLLQQYVEMTAAVEIEAASIQAARECVLTDLASGADWAPGEDAYEVRTYAIFEDDRLVWER
jgi:hypothetical protein